MKTLLIGADFYSFIVPFKLADVTTVNSNIFKPLTVNNIVLLCCSEQIGNDCRQFVTRPYITSPFYLTRLRVLRKKDSKAALTKVLARKHEAGPLPRCKTADGMRDFNKQVPFLETFQSWLTLPEIPVHLSVNMMHYKGHFMTLMH